MTINSRYQQAKRITLIGVVINVLLSILKIVFGIVGYSQALFADGIHSISDVFTDILVLFAAKAGNQAPDSKHPYGHGRIETVFAVVLSIILVLVSIGIIYDAIYHGILHLKTVKPAMITIVVAIISILANELLFYFTLRVGRRTNSNILKANAWHHRSDSWSSLIVLFGIIGAKFGVPYLDATAAIIVALLILKISINIGWCSIQELIDSSVSPGLLEQFHQVSQKVNGVYAIHQMRTRSLGGSIFVEVHIQVDPKISVSEGHFIADQLLKILMKTFPQIVDVMVHVDSEDDGLYISSVLLPSREELKKQLENVWNGLPGAKEIKKISLHYLNDTIEVEVYLPISVLNETINKEELKEQYQQKAVQLTYITKIKIYYF